MRISRKNDTVEIEPFKDKYSSRVGLKFRYNPDVNEHLKETLGWPTFQWNKDRKQWSVEDNRVTLVMAADVMTQYGYDCKAMYDRAQIHPSNQKGPNDCWVDVQGSTLKLHWPFIKDGDKRSRVLNAVKSIEGRKWDPVKKNWGIPLAQSQVLHSLLEKEYPPLAEAIISCEQVESSVIDSIARVEMSGAAELKPVKLKELSQKLDDNLPPHLELFPFQKVGVAFIEASNGKCLIGDEMGIGKTIQAIGYAAINRRYRPCIVFCPANVKYNWKQELNKWLPGETVQVVNSGKDKIEYNDFVIINYDLATKKQDELIRLNPQMSFIDEVHYLKNEKAKRTESTLTVAMCTPRVVALSGTAITNRPKEFFNALHMLRPELFGSRWHFLQRYCDPWHNGFGWNFDGASNISELNERTRDLCIRRLKKEVLPDLPPKLRTFLPVSLSKEERKEYDISQEEWEERINRYYLNGEPLPKGMMLNMLSDLRHTCGRMKVRYASDWIRDYKHGSDKPLVVFAHHRDVISNLVDRLNDEFTVATITGSTPANQRQDIVNEFQKGTNIDVLICNTIAAKEGLTLTAADTVLFIEREWVPASEEQAEDRIYRIGQESSSVHAVYLSCIGTIDEEFDRMVEQKRAVVKAVLDGGDEEQRKSLVSELVKRMKAEHGLNVKQIRRGKK